MNTSEFIVACQRAIGVPTYQGRFSDDDFLALANEEMRLTVVPLMTSARREHAVVTKEQTLTVGTDAYRIPERAAARALRDVFYQGTDLNTVSHQAKQLHA